MNAFFVKPIMSRWGCLLWLFFLMSFMCAGQPFNYKNIKQNSIMFVRKYIDLNQDSMYGDRLRSYGALAMHKSKIIKFKVSSRPLIFHYCNDSISDLPKNNQIEYFTYYDQKICLDSLLNRSANDVKRGKNEYFTFSGLFFLFNYDGREFFIMHFEQRVFLRNLCRYAMVLLEIRNNLVVNSFAFIDTPEDTPDCFGDFNNDGKLDYLDWRKFANRVSLYSLRNSEFIKDKKHYISVVPTLQQKTYMKQYDDLFNFDSVDAKKSKWFYKL